MYEGWENISLERIYKKLVALESALFLVSNNLTSFIEDAKWDKKREKMIVDDIDVVIYGQETIEGVENFLGDIKDDVMSVQESITENKEEKSKKNKEVIDEDKYKRPDGPPDASDIPDRI